MLQSILPCTEKPHNLTLCYDLLNHVNNQLQNEKEILSIKYLKDFHVYDYCNTKCVSVDAI